jgi:thiol-disulfide isomerase/thioredoxin
MDPATNRRRVRSSNPVMAKAFLIALWIFLGTAFAQSDFTACNVAPEISAELDKAITLASDPTLPFRARMAGFNDLLARYPTEPFVNRRFLETLCGYALTPLYDRELPRYEALYAEQPTDTVRRYLLAIAHQRRDPKGSAAIQEALIRELPSAPWPQFALARNDKSGAYLERFAAICPETLDSAALHLIAENGPDDLKRRTAERLRRQLAHRVDWQALYAWPVLWQLEFQITSAAGHNALRRAIEKDIAELGKSKTDPRVLAAIYQGYKLTENTEGRRAVQAELMRVAPKSKAAANAAVAEWDVRNPYPERSSPWAEKVTWWQRNYVAARSWVELWPNFDAAYRPLYTALTMLEDQPKEQIALIGRQLAGFIERNPDCTLGFTDVPWEGVADRLATASVDLDLVPALLDGALANIKARQQSDLASATRTVPADQIADAVQIRTWEVGKARAILQFRSGDLEGAREVLESLRKEVNATPAGNAFWRGAVSVAEAGMIIGAMPAVRDAVARMNSALESETAIADSAIKKRNTAMHRVAYWETRARVARTEGRGADAVAFFLNAEDAVPRDFDPAGRTRLAAAARIMWQAIGGTDEGWAAYRPGVAVSGAEQWTSVGRAMPPFALEDISGHRISLADLAGKTVFINVWATWCGPCQGELPWVQRLYDAVKDRRDLVVLTFNSDENPGLVGQYMREHNFTFPVLLARAFIEDTMKVEFIPRNWIVDTAGVLRFERQAGFDETFIKDTMEALARAAR